MDNSFNSLIDSAAGVLILLPTKPYFDQVAAGLALYLCLHDKKGVAISCPSPMTVGFNRLIGVNKIVSEIGNKNLTIKFKDYEAANIEKVSYDIIDGQFNLTVTPKAGFTAPQKDQIDLSYSGASADLIILVGGANDSHFPILESEEITGAKLAHVGTRTLASNHEVMSFASSASSTSELVASIIKKNELPLDADTATNLVMGIEEGSSNFTTNEVTPDTFEIFAWLLRSGGQRLPKTKLSPISFPVGTIPAQPLSTPARTQIEPILEQVEGKEEPARNASQSDAGGEQNINPPEDWLQQPKIYKGTSVS